MNVLKRKEETHMKDLIRYVEQSQLRSDLPKIEIGDLLKVYLKVKEGNRERLQLFEGYLIAMQGSGDTEGEGCRIFIVYIMLG